MAQAEQKGHAGNILRVSVGGNMDHGLLLVLLLRTHTLVGGGGGAAAVVSQQGMQLS